MKLRYVALLAGLCVMLGAQGAQGGEEVSYMGRKFARVATAEQFVASIAAGKDVLVARDTELNLTPLLNDAALWRGKGYEWLSDYESRSVPGRYVASEQVNDGRQLSVVGFKKVTIAGEGGSSIVVEPRYAFCLNFVNCEQVDLLNLTIGHTIGGYCEGGVIGAAGCGKVSLGECDLYGCGTYGLEISDTRYVSMLDSSIHDCTYGIMTLVGVQSARFDRCDFYRNREYGLVESRQSGVTFSECRFYDNNPTSFVFNIDNDFNLEGCYLLHPFERLGAIEQTDQSGNYFIEDTNDPNFIGRDAGPGGVRVNVNGREPAMSELIDAIIAGSPSDASGCGEWVRAWQQGRAAEVGPDYARLERETPDGVVFDEFRVYGFQDGLHRLVAHSSGMVSDGKAVDGGGCAGVKFYNYSDLSRLINYAGGEYQMLGCRPTRSSAAAYLLKPDSENITYLDADGIYVEYIWNGEWFVNGIEFGYTNIVRD